MDDSLAAVARDKFSLNMFSSIYCMALEILEDWFISGRLSLLNSEKILFSIAEESYLYGPVFLVQHSSSSLKSFSYLL